jgi:hypothetical protein
MDHSNQIVQDQSYKELLERVLKYSEFDRSAT